MYNIPQCPRRNTRVYLSVHAETQEKSPVCKKGKIETPGGNPD